MSSEALWRRLERELARRVDEFPGVAGVSVKDLVSGTGVGVGADELFPTASTIKIHVLTRLLQRVERGEIKLEERIRLTPEIRVPGSGVLTYLEGDVDLSLLDVAILMITVSDNTATNLCIDRAGIDATNQMLRELGLARTTLRRKMQDHAASARGDENVATPAECVAMLECLHAGRPTPWVAERVLSILRKWKQGPLNRALPATIPVANKPGGMDRVRCDAGIVSLPRRPYAIAIMTKFGIRDAAQQEWFIVEAAQFVHETMVTLDGSSVHGQGIKT
jgi:beta-lactamase class A